MKKKIQSHSNTAILCKLGKALTVWTCLFSFYFILPVCAQFCDEIERCQL